ncbi:hypothetical protein [Sphingomonas mollis]|uniref:Uncharacterized protein n=1 Tax=Sphingomonas mollis TaxID=2795726 RepID=A0ABS0XSJ3_9SPHN|nr:hypothetical protein [Sphingomonas sp. BT553]MBJ6122997.1 hypothetical protein [Sphingomonas sp. BT553]
MYARRGERHHLHLDPGLVHRVQPRPAQFKERRGQIGEIENRIAGNRRQFAPGGLDLGQQEMFFEDDDLHLTAFRFRRWLQMT